MSRGTARRTGAILRQSGHGGHGPRDAGVASAWYDPVEQCPVVRFDDGQVALWSELSDGYHVFIAVVAESLGAL
jgi:hypothetical protein